MIELWQQALGFGLFSALSLPIGAVLGILLSPVSEKVTARWMAFGSGALVFAVATQLYGQALDRLMYSARDGCKSDCVSNTRNLLLMIAMGVVGALMYLALNRWLEAFTQRRAANLSVAGAAASGVRDDAAACDSGTAQPQASPQVSQVLRWSLSSDAGWPASAGGANATGDARMVRRASSPTAAAARRPRVPRLPPIRALSSLRRAVTRGALDPPAPALSPGAGAASLLGSSPPSVAAPIAAEPIAAMGGSLVLLDLQETDSDAGDADLDEHVKQNVALSMWLGLLLDGIPESLMLGFMTNEGHISFEFLIAIFIANFPEAFSGASLLKKQGMGVRRVFLMWFFVFAATGLLSMCGSLVMPDTVVADSVLDRVRNTSTAALEGLTGGAMLAMISTAMIPEAFRGAGEAAGLLFVLGFAVSVLISCLGTRFGGPQTMAVSLAAW